MLCAHDGGVKSAVVLRLKSKGEIKNNTKHVCRCWSCEENLFFEYGVYVMCNAYSICAVDVVDNNSIALR